MAPNGTEVELPLLGERERDQSDGEWFNFTQFYVWEQHFVLALLAHSLVFFLCHKWIQDEVLVESGRISPISLEVTPPLHQITTKH